VTDPDLERIKQILVGDIRVALDAVEKNFETEAFSDRVAEVVAEALAKRAEIDDGVADVLAPTIDQAITGSIDQDPKKLAESLYPIMGPAIRKSISETLQQMLENFNQLLEESLSPKSLRWRFDAWRTGKSYSELVMLNTMEYHIEQVFLIHRETSLLIQHQLSDLADAKDPDMVSSMFSAIQDFIEDSFSTDDTNELSSLRLGDLTVLIQRGPSAVLAAVIRGRVPENLRSQMIELLENLHLRKRSQLVEYSGDPDDFLDVEPDVRLLLQAERKEEVEKERKIPWLALFSIAVLLSFAGYWQWIGSNISDNQAMILDRLKSEPGLVLLGADQSRDQLAVKLLADPDAKNPQDFISVPPVEDKFGFEFSVESMPFLSLDSEILIRRAERILAPEAGTELEVMAQPIVLSGKGSIQWFKDTTARWTSITGVTALDTSQFVAIDYELEEVNTLVSEVESFSFEFDKADASIDVETEKFQALLFNLTRLLEAAGKYDMSVQIDVVGFTDPTGSDRVNRVLGQNRADTVAARLAERDIPASILSTYSSQNYQTDLSSDRRETRLIVTVERPR
jgi:hypothetical protein